MDKGLEHSVRQRADARCEYCGLPEGLAELPLILDHIIAKQHRGKSVLDNLSLSCGICNRHKGPNIAGLDPTTEALTSLFHPRNDRWSDHFAWNGARIVPRTDIGRTTEYVLGMNTPQQIERRQSLMDEGAWPT